MKLEDVLSPALTLCDAPGGSKKRIIEFLAGIFSDANSEIAPEELYDLLWERERLGSTGIGDGVAIPHCRLPGISKATAVFLKLNEKVDFDAIDDQPVDLVFALIVPDGESDQHLQTLSQLAEIFMDADSCGRLRGATTSQQLFNTLIACTS